MMRIIGGKHRSRKLLLPDDDSVRPTSDRAREALFSMLTHRLGDLDGVVLLDAFCGSGALGLEALSRGATHIIFIDNNAKSLGLARQNAQLLKELDACTFIQASATLPPPPPQLCHLLLLDAPYNKGLSAPALAALTPWAAPAALAAVEVARDESFEVPEDWELLTERAHGAARLVLLQRLT
jgi:16S rRNA (guanine966-N2)-methyltransferase